MKATVLLSLTLDASAIGILLTPEVKFRWLSGDDKVIRNAKRAAFFLLLISGFLIDRYITHGGA